MVSSYLFLDVNRTETTTSKGQIFIPAEVRRRFGIAAGTRIAVSIDEETETIILKPITKQFIDRLRGIDRGEGMLRALAEERSRDRAREMFTLKRSKKSRLRT